MEAKRLCVYCSESVSSLKELKRHLKQFHLGQALSCDDCDYITDSTESLNQHKKEKSHVKIVRCGFCNFMGLPKELQEHKLKEHQTKQTVVKEYEEVYECTVCSFATSEIVNVARHLLDSHGFGSVVHKCHVCDSLEDTRDALELHFQQKHIELREKVAVHSDRLPSTCRFCKFSSEKKQDFVNHLGVVHNIFPTSSNDLASFM